MSYFTIEHGIILTNSYIDICYEAKGLALVVKIGPQS